MHLNFRNVNDAFRNLVTIFQGYVHDQRHMFQIDNGWKPVVVECDMRKAPSRNGNVLIIDEPVTITYSHPKERVLFNAARDANPFFHLYEALWMLAGRNDVAPLAYYNSRIHEFSDDGETFNGAYGYRWRSAWTSWHSDVRDNVNQLELIVNHLKVKPDSRRAVLQMWNVEDDLLKIDTEPDPPCKKCNGTKLTLGTETIYCQYCVGTGRERKGVPASKDVCCNLSVMFSLRVATQREIETHAHNGYLLDMTVTNRSNDMIWGMLGANYVHFSILQEYVAAHIRAGVGRYNHFTNNLHVYEWNWKPEEWLNAEAPQDKYPVGYEYDEPGYAHFPLIQDPEIFDLELPLVVNHFDGVTKTDQRIDELVEPFLRNVAAPMLRAFQLYKHGELETALRMCGLVKAHDWRIAAEGWIKRRVERAQGK